MKKRTPSLIGPVFHNRVSGKNYPNAFGLAIYLPDSYNPGYDLLMWAADSKWGDFLKWIK